MSFYLLRMWTLYEISKIQEMYANLQTESVEDYLSTELIEVIKNTSEMAFENIRYALYSMLVISCIQYTVYRMTHCL